SALIAQEVFHRLEAVSQGLAVSPQPVKRRDRRRLAGLEERLPRPGSPASMHYGAPQNVPGPARVMDAFPNLVLPEGAPARLLAKRREVGHEGAVVRAVEPFQKAAHGSATLDSPYGANLGQPRLLRIGPRAGILLQIEQRHVGVSDGAERPG